MKLNNITDVAEKWLGVSVSDLEKSLYKGTACGAWINWDDSKVSIGSIVEGSDAEFDETFLFPVESEALDDWLDELENLTDEAWKEANCSEGEEYYE